LSGFASKAATNVLFDYYVELTLGHTFPRRRAAEAESSAADG
jgi:hypothetical protein